MAHYNHIVISVTYNNHRFDTDIYGPFPTKREAERAMLLRSHIDHTIVPIYEDIEHNPYVAYAAAIYDAHDGTTIRFINGDAARSKTQACKSFDHAKFMHTAPENIKEMLPAKIFNLKTGEISDYFHVSK